MAKINIVSGVLLGVKDNKDKRLEKCKQSDKEPL